MIPDDQKVKEDWFLKKLRAQQIKYAIDFLQVEALRKYIVKNEYLPIENPFEQLFYTHYPADKNIEAIKEIIKILIDNYDNHYDLITKSVPSSKNSEHIMDLLYSFLPDDQDNLCSICLQTEPRKMLINICKCKTGVHVKCLVQLNEHKPLNDCSVCKGKYKINEPVEVIKFNMFNERLVRQEILFFPYNDIYRTPMTLSDTLHKFEGMSRLTMSIMYLQVGRVRELLEKKEVVDNLSNYYFDYEGYKQSPIHALCHGRLASNANYNIGNNSIKYCKIMRMLLKTDKFDLEQKDAFDKKPIDYVDNYKLDNLRDILVKYSIDKMSLE